MQSSIDLCIGCLIIFRDIIEPICSSKAIGVDAVGVYLDDDRSYTLPLSYDVYGLAGRQIHVIGKRGGYVSLGSYNKLLPPLHVVALTIILSPLHCFIAAGVGVGTAFGWGVYVELCLTCNIISLLSLPYSSPPNLCSSTHTPPTFLPPSVSHYFSLSPPPSLCIPTLLPLSVSLHFHFIDLFKFDHCDD